MISDIFSSRRTTAKNLLYLVLFSLLLSGCTGLVMTEQPLAVNWASLFAKQTVGQTFVAKFDGLTGIYFYLSPQETGNGVIKLHLRAGPQAKNDLAVSMNDLSVDAVKVPGYYGFFVPAQASSTQKYYYAYLEVVGSGDIRVGEAAGDAYLNGAFYQGGTPEDAQTAFQLSYSRRLALLGLGLEAINWIGILAIGFFLFCLPGWGLFSLFWSGWGRLSWPEKLGLSAGLSLALYPLLLLWTNIFDIHLGAIYAWLPPLIGLGMILWQNRKRLNVHALPRQNRLIFPWADVTFGILVALVILSRFWVIRSLDMPMWGDSYQHTMIAQLLIDHGGLFSSWQPYAEMTTLTYHYGFHTSVAVFDWITHLDISKAVLWVGQLLNILAVIVLYPLATKVGRSQWAGVVAVLVAGLLSPMPMYYVNWGRYTQLAGQDILPVAIYLAWTTLERKIQTTELHTLPGSIWRKLRSLIPSDIGAIAIGWIIMGGLAVTHYRILIFAILFFIAFYLLEIRRDTWRTLLVRILWIGIGAGLLFLPWFIHIYAGKIMSAFSVRLHTPASAVSTGTEEYNAVGNLFAYLPVLLWLILPISIAWGFWKREKNVAIISLWWFLILLAANPQWLSLPGEGALSNFAVFIAAYIPVSVLAGYLAGWIASLRTYFKDNLKSFALSLTIFIFILGGGVLGVRERLKDLDVNMSVLVTRPDIQAAEWIQKNTPQDARFLVNSFFAYGGSSIVGSDAGWWLPLLARRQTTLPPLTYSAERGPRPDYVAWVNALTVEIQKEGITNPDVLALLQSRNVSYVYVGQRQGRVNYGGPDVLNLEQLTSSPNYHLVYHLDRVWIFKIVP